MQTTPLINHWGFLVIKFGAKLSPIRETFCVACFHGVLPDRN
ncbi:hypothetical protein RintRC_5285 [Richelia intracellularis]|nr:hypothetical protein RintRC_5285 [Richelia intracellularis]